METWVQKLSSFEEEQDADRELWARLTPDERVALRDHRLPWVIYVVGRPEGR